MIGKTIKNVVIEFTLLKRRKPSPQIANPRYIIFLGPSLSIRYPSNGPRRLLSSLLNEKAIDSKPLFVPKDAANGTKKTGKP